MQERVDALEDVLRGIRLERATPYVLELRGPWGFEVPARPGMIACYFVIEGRCLADVGPKSAGWLGPGDAAMILGVDYRFRSAEGVPTAPLCTFEPETGLKRHYEVEGEGPLTRLVVVALRADRELTNPLLLALPSWLRVEGEQGRPAPRLEATLAMLQEELASEVPGGAVVMGRLGEILLVQLLRSYLLNRPCGKGTDDLRGYLRGMADERLSRALRAMHNDSRHPWTVAELGVTAAMSRTAFAVLFSELVGVSPLVYLRRLRLHHASALLRDGDDGLAAIADAVGYTSEAAFGRAFKRELGESPAAWRRQARSS